MAADDPAAAYNRIVAAEPRAAAEQAEWLADAFARGGVTYDGRPMRTCLRPHLIARADWQRLRTEGRRLLDLAVRVARTAFDGDAHALCAWLGQPEAHARWI